MLKKLCAWILVFSICLPFCTVKATAGDDADLMYIDIRRAAYSEVTRCPVLVKGQRIYLSVEDLAWAAGYELEWDEDGDAVSFICDSVVLCVGIYLDADEAIAMGRAFEMPSIKHDGTVFLDMEKALYLLHAQWCIEGDRLAVGELGNNLLEFWEQHAEDLYWLMITTSDLMQGGETEFEFNLRTGLAAILNDFNMKTFLTPYLALDEECEDALLLLLDEDKELFTDDTVASINALVSHDTDESLGDYLSSAINVAQMPSTVDDLVEFYKKVAEIEPTLEFSVWNDAKMFDRDIMQGVTAKHLEAAETALTLIEMCSSVHEVYTRSRQWGDDFINSLRLLCQINDNSYGTAGKEFRSAADRLLKEKADPYAAAFSKGAEEFFLFAAEELTPAGKFVSIVNASMAILKTAPALKVQIEAADMMHMANQLTHVEAIALNECLNTYEMYAIVRSNIEASGDSGVIQNMFHYWLENNLPVEEDAIKRMRCATTLLLRSIVRAQGLSYSFYTNCYVNNHFNQTVADVKYQELCQTYAYLIELQASANYDKQLLLKEDYKDLYSDEAGAIRVQVDLDILQKEPETFSSETVVALYMDFLKNKSYLPYISHWWCEPPSEYALLDIDQNGVPELILHGTDGRGFYNFTVFGYDALEKAVYALTPESLAGVSSGYCGQYYGELEYSARYSALVFTETNDGYMFGGIGYYFISDRTLSLDFHLYFERSTDQQETKYSMFGQNGLVKTLSEDEWNEFMMERTPLEWTPIPEKDGFTIIAGNPGGLMENKTDLLEYLNLGLYEFVDFFGPMYYDEDNADPLFSTNEITVAGVEEGTIHYISIDSDCDYSLSGIAYGMSLNDALAVVKDRGYELESYPLEEPKEFALVLSETPTTIAGIYFRVDEMSCVVELHYVDEYKG